MIRRIAWMLINTLTLTACDGYAIVGKACRKGKSCGMSCIPQDSTCHKG
jgi:hypothetical protein